MKNFYFLVTLSLSFTIYPMIHIYNNSAGDKNLSVSAVKLTHSYSLDMHNFFARPLYCESKFIDRNWYELYELLEKKTQFKIDESLSILQGREHSKFTNPVVFLHKDNVDDINNSETQKQFFVLKCYMSEVGEKQAIREAIGAHVGSSMGININKVKIIPRSMHFIGKSECITGQSVATLHTGVPGIEVDKLGYGMPDISEALAFEWGLRDIVCHDDLCDIVALDIFLDNNDRHKGNYMYDQKHYYAIDMDKIFDSYQKEDSVVYRSIRLLKKYLPNNWYANMLSQEQKRSLARVNWRLKGFLSVYSEQRLYEVWMQKAKEAEFRYSKKEQEDLKTKLRENNKYVKKLIALIDRLTS